MPKRIRGSHASNEKASKLRNETLCRDDSDPFAKDIEVSCKNQQRFSPSGVSWSW